MTVQLSLGMAVRQRLQVFPKHILTAQRSSSYAIFIGTIELQHMLTIILVRHTQTNLHRVMTFDVIVKGTMLVVSHCVLANTVIFRGSVYEEKVRQIEEMN